MSLLEVRGLHVGYGLLPVIQGLDLTIEEGTMTVLLGLNGAGKTTTVSAIAGVLRPTAGQVIVDGVQTNGLSPDEVLRHGVSLCPEGRHVFGHLSVKTNLELGAWTTRRNMKHKMEQVFSYFPVLAKRSSQMAGSLSGGEQQMLAIGRALMSEPRLLLVDEASLGLAPIMAKNVFSVVNQIKRDGTTTILVEQNVGALAMADRALVMEKGRITFDGPAAELEESGELRRAYLGSSNDDTGTDIGDGAATGIEAASEPITVLGEVAGPVVSGYEDTVAGGYEDPVAGGYEDSVAGGYEDSVVSGRTDRASGIEAPEDGTPGTH